MEVFQKFFAERSAEGTLRVLRELDSPAGPTVSMDGGELICLCSNDYLGLANDPAVRRAAVEAIEKWGVGSGASRLISGTQTPHTELERRLAEFKRAEAALVTSTGWQANHVAVAALAGAGDLILFDKLNHASIIDAAKASGARLRTYPHCDVERLAKLLEKHRGEHKRCLIVTDSLFSMDGDVAPLQKLVELKNRYDAVLMVDEAHATGVLGAEGRGAAELLGVESEIDVTVGTLSKAIGALGGFVAGPRPLIEMIVNTGRAFIYTTALPAAICAAAMKSLDIIRDEPARRQKLLTMAKELRDALGTKACGRPAAGFNKDGNGAEAITSSTSPERKPVPKGRGDAVEIVTQIIPVVIGDAAEAVRISGELFEAGFLVPAIRPPTVPRGASRLRVSLSSAHDPADIRRFADTFNSLFIR